MRIADPLPKAERTAVDAVGAGDGRHDGIDQSEAAVAMAMPVEADLRLHLVEHLPDVAHHRARAVWGGVTNGVADRDPLGALFDGGAEEAAKRLRLRSGRVFRDVHDRQLVLAGGAAGGSSGGRPPLHGPSRGGLPDRAGPDEGRDLDRNPDPLRNLYHR